MKAILEIKDISKKFRVSKIKDPYLSLREHMRNWSRPSGQFIDFWALKDVSFDVFPGESVGIIGRNGAGKSTLLKILSKITPPTSGKIISRGRIASLLEVGTGFHPELTGRENIYLNGSILGLKRKEITKHFEAIVEFSGVESFIDTPLKRFSSGMQLRLAFAVAAHLEPEILIIDEVLAVGDAEFQKKCLGKMDEVSKSGRTILFVSHDINAITKLCPKSIVLNNGQVEFFDQSQKAAEYYHNITTAKNQSQNLFSVENTIFFKNIVIVQSAINTGDDLEIDFEIDKDFHHKNIVININVTDFMGNLIAHILNYDDEKFSVENLSVKVLIKNINLPIGNYYLSFWAGLDSASSIEYLPNVMGFEIISVGNFIKRISMTPSHARLIFKSEWN